MHLSLRGALVTRWSGVQGATVPGASTPRWQHGRVVCVRSSSGSERARPARQQQRHHQQQLSALQEERDASIELARVCAQRSRRLLARAQGLARYAGEQVARGDASGAAALMRTRSQVQQTLELNISRGKNNLALAAKLESIIDVRELEELVRLLRDVA
ncbi:hypothetical protein FOA52_005406 [Chlamydomonas sp. UWO 241]|nr:hypothetical protein FOA52_005406 [Chlamydomonas sp. UWO 241]